MRHDKIAISGQGKSYWSYGWAYADPRAEDYACYAEQLGIDPYNFFVSYNGEPVCGVVNAVR